MRPSIDLPKIIALHQQWLNGEKQGVKASLIDVTLCGTDFRDAELSYTNFRGAELSYTNFRDADLSYTNFRGADLTNADLTDADLTGADLAGADLTRANLTRAQLKYANLTGANLIKCIGDGVSIHSFITKPWHIVVSKDSIHIGCRIFSRDAWFKITPERALTLVNRNVEEVEGIFNTQGLVDVWKPVIDNTLNQISENTGGT